jgi:hypothetical protein
VGIPQVMYLENVLPTSEGFQSVGYKTTGAVTIPAEATINTLETIQVASTVDAEVITGDITIEDTGDSLGEYTTGSNAEWPATGLTTYDYDVWNTNTFVYLASVDNGISRVFPFTNLFPTQTTTYGLVHFLNNLDISLSNFPAYMYRYVGPLAANSTTDLEFNWQFYLEPGDSNTAPVSPEWEARMDAGIGVAASGAGLRVVYSTIDEKLYIKTSTGSWGVENQTTLQELPLVLSITTWYKAQVVAAYNSATERIDVTVTIRDSADTILALLIQELPEGFAFNNYIGFGLQTPKFDLVDSTEPPEGYRPNLVAYAAMEFTAEIPDTATTILSDVVPIDFVFFSDDTVTASRNAVDTFENLAVTVPEDFESPASSDKFSSATVRGRCFVAIKKADDTTKIYEVHYEDPGYSFEDITATISSSLGSLISINSVLGVAGSYNYLILYTKVSYHWSSTTTVTDFAASLVSGAGSEYIANLKGDISFCKSHVAGLYIYTSGNVLFAAYTGNARYPWKFREISDSGGYSYSQQVSGDTNSAAQRGISNSRVVQNLAPDSASLVAPEASTFFERTKIWDTFNFTSFVFELLRESETVSLLDVDNKYRIWDYLDRYLFVPYQQTDNTTLYAYEQVLVYDALLARYGKLALQHHCLTANSKSIYAYNFITGEKWKLLFDIYDPDWDITNPSIMLLGKYQVARDKFLTLQELSVESAQNETFETRDFVVRAYRTLDGKNFLAPVVLVPVTADSSGSLASYKARVTGKNISLAFFGRFDISSLELTITLDGDR